MDGEKRRYYSRILFKTVVLVFTLVILFLAYKLAMFYVPFIIAFLIATMIEPLIKFFMNKCKLKRKASASISLILVVLIIGSLLAVLISAIISESKVLLTNLNSSMDDVYNWGLGLINNFANGNFVIPNDWISVIQDSLGSILEVVKNVVYSFATGIINFAGQVPGAITYTVITILAIIFMCFDRDYVKKLLKDQIPKKWLEKANEIVVKSLKIIWNYIKAEAKLSLLCFILVTIGLCIFNLCGLNIEYVAIMAILIGFVDLLPLFGAGFIMVPWAIILIIQGNAPAGIAIFVLWLAWSIIKQFLEPKFVSKQMGMHPIFTLLGMYTGFKLFGVIGLLLGPIIFLIIREVFSNNVHKGILKDFFELE